MYPQGKKFKCAKTEKNIVFESIWISVDIAKKTTTNYKRT